MGFDFTGFVLRAPRTAPSNATTTDEVTNGVDRDFKGLSDDYSIAAPELVELSADQYRSAVLLRPDDGQTEYLLWAANTANLADSAGFEVNDGTATIPRGTISVENEATDFAGTRGTDRIIIVDDATRNISEIIDLVLKRGDTGDTFQLVGVGTWNSVSGIFTITDEATLFSLGGGVSRYRGDRVTELKYRIEAPTFWWSKNDRYENRFKWDGAVQRWKPLKGTPPRNLGTLFADTEYVLSPAPTTVSIGSYLPGDSTAPDSYCAVRLGRRPDAASVPVAEPVAASGFGGIKVLLDDELEEFSFSSEPTLAGVVGQVTGTLVWNPAFVEEYAGQTIFYSYQGFVDQVEIEPLGQLEDADVNLLFIAPIPGPTDFPFIRIGSRQALQVKFADTEGLLANTTIDEGEVGVALSTGRLKFSDVDLAKADPEDPGFDNTYLGAEVFYDGVSLTRRPVPLRRPVQLVNGAGNPTTVGDKKHNIYIPDAVPSPATGISGVVHVPDTTGTIPNTDVPAGIRYGNGSGLLREIEGPWDVVLFTSNGQIKTIKTYDDDDEPPRFRFRIPRGTAYVDKRLGSGGSAVLLGREDLKRFEGKAMYFLQSGVQPSIFADEARMFSRVRNEFVLEGTEVFVFAINGNEAIWDASTDPGGVATSAGGTFTAEEIATSLNAVAIGGSVIALSGRVVLQTSTVENEDHYGTIEIGYGPGGTKDLSGPAALGFLPGWVLRIASPFAIDPDPDLAWLPDNGTHMGVFRSPFNLSGTKDTIADVNYIARFNDEVLLTSIPDSPVVLLDRVPLEDVAGYDQNVFFRLQDGLATYDLDNYEDVYHQFGLEQFSWADEFRQNETVEQPTNNLFLGQGVVIANSFRLPGKGMRLSVGGQPFEEQTVNEDFLLPDGGDSGFAILVEAVGPLKQLGGRGTFTQGTTLFLDNSSDIDFVELGVKAGWQLKITQGNAEGTYVVAEDATQTNSLTVEQQFPATDSVVPWELYEGKTREEIDLGVVADAQYVQFEHLPEEPFKVRVLSPLGDVPTSASEQEANRLVAVLGDALQTGRPISIRYGREHTSSTAQMIGLTETNLGEIVNSALTVPDPTGDRFVDDAFSIRVGTKAYTFAAGDLIKVAGALTYPLSGDVIEVQEVSGMLNFGADVFTQFEGQDAIYVEDFLSPSLLTVGVVEYRPSNGELNFSQAAFSEFGGEEAYLVEQMIATGGVDVTLNPIQGSFLFTKPLREFQIVEVNYFRALRGSGNLYEEETETSGTPGQIVAVSLEPVEITEQLPLFVRLDAATPSEAEPTHRWFFNPTKRTVDEDIEIALYVGSTQYNIGSSPTAEFEIDNDNELYVASLEQPVDDTSTVQVTYAVFEAFGGEQSYTASQSPVWRPPFRIEENKTSFELEGDRTGDVTPGKFLRVAEFPFYITESTYDSTTDITTVEFVPDTQLEAGSRDPASDSLSLISDIPLATEIEPSAPDGFWVEVTAPYEPINRGFQNIIFQADLTAFLVPGHLLELGGLPFIISGVNLTEDGTRTQIDITSFFPRGFAFGQDTAKVSVRPVYQPQPEQFLGRGAVVADEPYELVLFGKTDASGNLLPGETLRPSIDYEINLDDGAIEFLNPPKGALQPTESLYLRHTQQRIIAPVQTGDIILRPRYDARFVHVVAPSEENNRLGKILRATYTFSNPDTFFYRTVPLLNYLAEVAEDISRDIAAQLPSQGPAPIVAPPVENAEQGSVGIKAELRNLEDTDRAARVFLDFYNQSIVAFEQVQETITGNIVGDRDGKFQFFIGKGKEIPPPGYEDPITGGLNRRNLFSEVFFGYNPKATYMTRDPVVDPSDFTIDGDQLEGPFIDPDYLRDLQDLQREFSMNDVDDIIMYGRTRRRLRLFPLRLEAFGRYQIMGYPHRFSRVFPEEAEAFTLTDPGIGADLEAIPINPGVYSFRKKIKRLSFKRNGGSFKVELPKRASTFFKPIGEIANPVLGTIENVGSIQVRDRLPRARIYAYSNVGFPEFDSLPFSTTNFTTKPRPAVIATPLPLRDFPIGERGLPDVLQLAAQGGEVIDLTTGDPDLFTPPFTIWTGPAPNPGLIEVPANLPKVGFGRPNGTIIDVAAGEPFSFELFGRTFTTTKSVFIGYIYLGCLITFVDEDGNDIDVDGLFEVAEDPAATNPPIELNRGDTVFVTPPDAQLVDAADVEEPPKTSQKAAQIKGMPGYSVGFDVNVDRPNGEYRDRSLPSYEDPSIFGIKELVGQNPPKPLSNLEASVTFRYGSTEPAALPALIGGFTNDSGDYTLPYLYAQNTEIDQLGIVQASFSNIFADSLVPNAVYPDEIQGADGEILGALTGTDPPAALLTGFDATPVTTAGAYYTPNSGVGDVVPFDVLLVETGQTGLGLPAGSQGILSVGHVAGGSSGSTIEPSRFVTPTLLGDAIRYRLKTAMSFVNQVPLITPPGMIIRRVPPITQFDITQISTGLLVFNDGDPGVVSGGLNNIFALGSGNIVRIHCWSAETPTAPPVFIDTITLDFGANLASSTTGASPIVSATADDNFIYVNTPGPFLTIGPGIQLPPIFSEDLSVFGDTLPLWFTIDIDLTAGVSTTGFIDTDRLTFDEEYDLRSMLPRTEPAVAGVPVFSELSIINVQTGGTVNCTVNGDAECNGGVPFTFLARNPSYPFVGTFDPVPGGTGRGTVRVMGFEGHGNAPIITTGPVAFSAIPSSLYPVDSATVIAQGIGVTGVATDRDFRISSDNFTWNVSAGALSSVEPGDVCFITGSSDSPPKATTKAGTYLVKHVIEPNSIATTETRELLMFTNTLPYNTQRGWAAIDFPTLVSSDVASSNELVLSRTLLESDGTTDAFDPTGGTLYFVVQPEPDASDYDTVNLKITYTAIDTSTNTFTVDGLTVREFSGAGVAPDAIDALPEGTIVTGFFRVDVRMDRVGTRVVGPPFVGPFTFTSESLPRNTVGFGSGASTAAGFSHLYIQGRVGGFGVSYPADLKLNVAPGVDEFSVFAATPIANTTFVDDENAYVYNDVPQYVQFNLAAGTWNALHPASAANVYAILPSDSLITSDGAATPGFHAQGGIFLEPSWPRPTLDLSGTDERVVDAGHSVPVSAIGFRDGTVFGEPPLALDGVTWEVRRIRRFHDVLRATGELLGPLRYVYQTRRGIVTDFGSATVGPEATNYPYVVTSAGGTQLGGFNDELVNISPGDRFRLFDDDGVTLLEEVEIGGIESADQIWLKSPGITVIPVGDVPGKPFEIYLRQVPVPHEQSNDELLDQITERVLLERVADMAAREGGHVPVGTAPAEPRRLKDTDSSINYGALEVLAGDIVVIDSAGLLVGPLGAIPSTGQERGTRPFGDRSVPNRTVATTGQEVPFIPGAPSELDDNRGWYRVTEVYSDHLVVSSQTEYSNDPGGGFVTFGIDVEYAVLPTVSGSTAPFADPPGGPGIEGQMDLRPTAFAGEYGSPANSFLGNLFSVAPFSYRIIRPSTLFSEEAVDLVLLMRERTLSFLDEFGLFFREDKFGNYFIFQRDEHAADLGNPLIPDEGKGVMSNELIDGVRGLVRISPYANTTDSLGVLDRRFWVNDYRLDSEFPPGSLPSVPSYATLESNANNPSADEGDGRPVLTDRIDSVLNDDDQFRELRYAWLDFRVNREDGSIHQIKLFEEQQQKRRSALLRKFSKLQDSFSAAGGQFRQAGETFGEELGDAFDE